LIVDGHAHLSPTDYGNVEAYVRLLRQEGIDRGVVVPGGMVDVRRMTDYVTGKRKPDNPVPNNDYLQECCQAEPSLHWFACVNPHDSDALDALEQQFRRGSSGLKLPPSPTSFPLPARP